MQENSHVQMLAESGELLALGSNVTEILVNDHHVIKALLVQLTGTADRDRRATLDHLRAALTIHNATEESLIYPALAVLTGDTPGAQRLSHATGEANTALFELEVMMVNSSSHEGTQKHGADSAFVAGARKLRAALIAHMDDEERDAFPRLQNAGSARTQLLGEEVLNFRRAIRFAAFALRADG